MELIHVQSILFEPLQIDYNKAKLEKRYNNQLNNGFDLLEANIKFIAVLLLAILKNENNEAYQKVFSAFRARSTLGNYYFILLEALSVECDSKFFQNIKSILLQKVNLELETASTILFGQNQLGQNQSKKIELFLNTANRKPNYKTDSILAYSLDFRNRIKGHSATFKEDEEDYAIRMLENLDKLLHSLQSYTNQILSINSFDFYTTSYLETKANLQNHHQHKLRKIILKFDDKKYELSPMIAYIECDRYTCSLNHRNKIFFINEVENSKSFYLDYLYNHMWRVNTTGSDWNIKSLENNLKELQKEIANNSNEERFNDLSKIFIGREKELNDLENFILNNIEQNSVSIITGKPGVGKSSFITKFQTKLLEKNENILTYIFYSIQGNNGENETKTFISKFRSYLYANDIKLDKIKNQNDEEISESEQIESTFLSLSKQEKPTILFIDGLDELQNPIAFLNNLPFASIKENIKLHFIFTTRDYGHITSLLSKKCANQTTLLLNGKENILKNGYSFEIDTLKYDETLELIDSVLPKEFTENSNSKDILDSIVEKSECLPIYIHYICEKIKNLDTITFETISEVALDLPDKLNEFYFDTFRKVPTLSRKILLTFFFSPYGVSKEELFILLKPDDIDITEFIMKYFDPIEIFLKEDENGYFTFYHLSLKDSIYRYYRDELKEIIEITQNPQEFYHDSTIFNEYIKGIIDEIQNNNNNVKLVYFIGSIENNLKLLKNLDVNTSDAKIKHFIEYSFLNIYSIFIINIFLNNTYDYKYKNTNEYFQNELKVYFKYFDFLNSSIRLNYELLFNTYKICLLSKQFGRAFEIYLKLRSFENDNFIIETVEVLSQKKDVVQFLNKNQQQFEKLYKTQKEFLIKKLLLNKIKLKNDNFYYNNSQIIEDFTKIFDIKLKKGKHVAYIEEIFNAEQEKLKLESFNANNFILDCISFILHTKDNTTINKIINFIDLNIHPSTLSLKPRIYLYYITNNPEYLPTENEVNDLFEIKLDIHNNFFSKLHFICLASNNHQVIKVLLAEFNKRFVHGFRYHILQAIFKKNITMNDEILKNIIKETPPIDIRISYAINLLTLDKYHRKDNEELRLYCEKIVNQNEIGLMYLKAFILSGNKQYYEISKDFYKNNFEINLQKHIARTSKINFNTWNILSNLNICEVTCMQKIALVCIQSSDSLTFEQINILDEYLKDSDVTYNKLMIYMHFYNITQNSNYLIAIKNELPKIVDDYSLVKLYSKLYNITQEQKLLDLVMKLGEKKLKYLLKAYEITSNYTLYLDIVKYVNNKLYFEPKKNILVDLIDRTNDINLINILTEKQLAWFKNTNSSKKYIQNVLLPHFKQCEICFVLKQKPFEYSYILKNLSQEDAIYIINLLFGTATYADKELYILIEQTKNLSQYSLKAKQSKNIEEYKKLQKEAEDIKNQISDDKELLNEFLTKYNIDEFEFETSNILDIIQTKETL